MPSNEALTAWATVGVFVATLIAFIVAYLAWRTARRSLSTAKDAIVKQSEDAVKANLHRRAVVTMQEMRLFRHQAGEHWRALNEHVRQQNILLPVALRSQTPDPMVTRYTRAILEDVERIALGARMEAFDLRIVYQLARSYIIEVHTEFQPYIEALRTGRGRKAQASAYEHFDWLVQEFQQELTPARKLPGTLSM